MRVGDLDRREEARRGVEVLRQAGAVLAKHGHRQLGQAVCGAAAHVSDECVADLCVG